MNKLLGVRVPINGRNVTETHCVECGRLLAQREYLEGSGLCQPCRKRRYDSGRNANKNELGENKVNDILNIKMRGDEGSERM